VADTALAVVKGVVAALTADAGMSALVSGRIYSDVPQGATFPYVLVSLSSKPFSAASFSGQTHTVRIQAFSRSASIAECLSVRKAALDALNRQESSIALDTGTLVQCEYSGDERCLHGRQRNNLAVGWRA
jgi:hypothetical protein